MIAHFFDIDTLIQVDNNIWIVSKSKPSIPIIKITQSEFNLIRNGIYKKYKSSLTINNNDYWLPENLMNQLKIKSKKFGFDITNLAFSMQEFTNKEVIKNLDFKILDQHFRHLKNKVDDIYVICSKKSKKSYEPIINKLEEELDKLGLKVTKFYYISETFYNRDDDEISFKKTRLLLQHLIGLKSDGDKFTNEEISKYDLIYYYDDDIKSLKTASSSNYILSSMLVNTDDVVKSEIRNKLKSYDTSLIVRKVTYNNINLFDDKEVNIEFSHINKTFESFNMIRESKK